MYAISAISHITITNSQVIAKGENINSTGIYYNNIDNNVAILTIEGVNTVVQATGGNSGIATFPNIKITGGVVIAKGEKGFGIATLDNAVSLENSANVRRLFATGGNYAISASRDLINIPTTLVGRYPFTGFNNPVDYFYPFKIIIDDQIKNGKVTTNQEQPDKAAPLDEIQLTVTPDDGFFLAELTVTDADKKKIAVTQDETNPSLYTFTMPVSDANVTAVFKMKKAPVLKTTDITYGENETITVELPEKTADEKVKLKVTGPDGQSTEKDLEIKSGKGTETIKMPTVGKYTVTASWEGNSLYFPATTSGEFSVAKRKSTITAASETWTYDGKAHSNSSVTVTSGPLVDGQKLKATASGSVLNVEDTSAGNNPIADGYQILSGDTDVTSYYEITAEAGTLTIVKADQTAPDAPSAETVGTTGITLKAITNGLYSKDGTNWQDKPSFTRLEPDTEYSFSQKTAEDKNHNESPASKAAKISTRAHVHNWNYTAQGATITAACGNTDGGHRGTLTATLTIAKPEHAVYNDGKSEKAVITGVIDGVENPSVVYKQGTEILTAAPTKAGTFTAAITLGDATASVEYTIGKAKAAVKTVPEAIEGLVYNGEPQTLVTTGTTSGGTMQYALGNDDVTVPSSGWSTSLPMEKNAGTHYVWYRVKGDGNHTDWVTKNPVPVTIGKAEVKAPEIADQVYTGQKLTAAVEASNLYTVTANDGGIDAGSYDVVLTLTDAANYKWPDSEEKAKTLAFRILPADKNEVAVAIGGWTYGATPEAPTVTASFSADTAVYTYSDAEDGTFSAEVPVNAGKWYVKATVPKTENYPGGKAVTGFEIAKAVSVAAAVTANNRSYDNTEKPLVTVDDSTLAGGEMRYALGKDEAAPDESSYVPAIPTGKDTGSYTVWYKVAGDENHEDTKPDHVTAVISPVDKEELKKIIGKASDYHAQIADGYPEIAEELKKAIDEAQEVYDNDNVTAEQVKEQIEKLKAALKAAKKSVKDADDKKAADAVSALIEALPMPEDITLDHAEAVEAARAAYDALTEDQKALGDPELVKKLEECEKAIAAIKEMGATYYIYAILNRDVEENSNGKVSAIAKRSFADEKAYERFTGVEYEGTALTSEQYEAQPGSVEITLKPAFLRKLPVGEHKVTLMFKDGSVDLPFRIIAKERTGGNSGGGSGHSSKPKAVPEPTVVPQTGDKANIPLWIGMVLLGICVGAAVLPKRKK